MPLQPYARRNRAGTLALALTMLLAPSVAQPRPSARPAPLAANDVSWLFPPPKTAADLSNLIAVKDLTVPDPVHPGSQVPVWTDADFAEFLAIADSPAAQVGASARIGLPQAVRTKAVWFVAGVRIDAGAPGLDPAITKVFGQRPQIRLILQPVLPGPGGAPQLQDITAHLIFDFVLPETPEAVAACPLHATPDLPAFSGIVSDAVALRDGLAAGQFAGVKVATAGQPLGVHPGLANPTTAPVLAGRMKAMLQARLSPTRLHSMAIMGLPSGNIAPWIFLSMLRMPSGHFLPVPSPSLDGTQSAMMLTGFGQTPRVAPTPHTNNLAPMTCASGVFGSASSPVASRRGRATAEVFATPTPSAATVKTITNLIADPKRSHFFNTDCISCHTETRQAMEVLHVTAPAGLSPSVLPNGPYNVRNFGWSPSIEGPVQGTVTRRTAAETAAVVRWINANALTK